MGHNRAMDFFMTQNNEDNYTPKLLKASIICLLSASFFVYEFFIQISPGVMTNELMRDLQIGAGGLGILSAFYYYAYTPMQLPAGLLFDRFGPRILLTFASCVCALGALSFGLAHTVAEAAAGRFLMGIGSAFAFTGTLLLVSRHPKRLTACAKSPVPINAPTELSNCNVPAKIAK